MIQVNIHEAKAKLAALLKMAAEGQKVVICRHNVPIAELVPLSQEQKTPRPIGLNKGDFVVGPEFFEPLPDDELALWNGEG